MWWDHQSKIRHGNQVLHSIVTFNYTNSMDFMQIHWIIILDLKRNMDEINLSSDEYSGSYVLSNVNKFYLILNQFNNDGKLELMTVLWTITPWVILTFYVTIYHSCPLRFGKLLAKEASTDDDILFFKSLCHFTYYMILKHTRSPVLSSHCRCSNSWKELRIEC